MQERLNFAFSVWETAGSTGRRSRDGLNGFELRTERGWHVLTDAGTRAGRGAGRPAGLGQLGLWRGGNGVRVFELPPLAFEGLGDAGGRLPLDASFIASLIEWAAATARGDVPENWEPPTRAEVEQWIGARRLTAGSGALVVLGVIVCEPRRLAFVFPHLARAAGILPPAREAWLTEVCAAVEERWRLVRCGRDAEGNVRAEVDLTGVPPELAPDLVRLSLEALICAVEWVLPSLHVVVDPDVASRVLGRRPPRA